MPKRIPLLLALLLASAALLAACGSSDDTGTTEADSTSGGSPCESVDAPPAKKDADLPAPKDDEPTAAGVTFDTSCGSFTVTFDDRAPKTAASFQYLAEEGFYDDTVFHRVVPGFVVQGGDPTQTGTGGPGYQTVDPPPVGAHYTRGDMAMAKAATEPAGTAGSQFFIVTGDDIGLPAEYAIVGEVTDGLDVVMAIDALGDAGTELPTRPVVIESVKVGESG